MDDREPTGGKPEGQPAVPPSEEQTVEIPLRSTDAAPTAEIPLRSTDAAPTAEIPLRSTDAAPTAETPLPGTPWQATDPGWPQPPGPPGPVPESSFGSAPSVVGAGGAVSAVGVAGVVGAAGGAPLGPPVPGPHGAPPTAEAAGAAEGENASAEAAARRPSGTWRSAVVALVAALIGAGVGGGIVAATVGNGNTTTTVKEISAGPALLNGTVDIETVIAKVLPAVVAIDAKSALTGNGAFDLPGSQAQQQDSQGSGMIISSSGEVVTNNHVIAGATNITVTLYGQTKARAATLVDADPTNDVALLQITGGANLPAVNYADSDNVQVGDGVVAIGNALGLSLGTPTVTQGIISAKGRTVTAGDAGSSSTETLSDLFQTDAAINPGNSGGPLVDSSGKVIAMNTAVAANSSGTSQAQNIGFAIPANKIQQLLPGLRNHSIGSGSKAGTGYLGVSLETVTPQLRSQYGFVPNQGAAVMQVTSGSPADTAGIQNGDVIVRLDGKAVTSADQLQVAIQADKPGQRVQIGLYRGQKQVTVTATLGSNPSSSP